MKVYADVLEALFVQNWCKTCCVTVKSVLERVIHSTWAACAC